jgi:hypothetical protein
MVDLEQLARRARAASEWGRARMAARVAVPIAPLALVPATTGADGTGCLVLAVVLFAAAAFLRWRDRLGVEVVRDGLLLGAVPVVAMFALHGGGYQCCAPGEITRADVACVLAGVVAGVGVTLSASRTRLGAGRGRRWLLTLVVAALTTSLGCLGLGMGGLVATLATVAVCSTVAWLPVLQLES